MANTQKVTVTLPVEQVDAIRSLVESGEADSVSGFVTHAVSVSLDDVSGWAALLAESLATSGGPMTDAERAWADSVLAPEGRRRGRTRPNRSGTAA